MTGEFNSQHVVTNKKVNPKSILLGAVDSYKDVTGKECTFFWDITCIGGSLAVAEELEVGDRIIINKGNVTLQESGGKVRGKILAYTIARIKKADKLHERSEAPAQEKKYEALPTDDSDNPF